MPVASLAVRVSPIPTGRHKDAMSRGYRRYKRTYGSGGHCQRGVMRARGGDRNGEMALCTLAFAHLLASGLVFGLEAAFASELVWGFVYLFTPVGWVPSLALGLLIAIVVDKYDCSRNLRRRSEEEKWNARQRKAWTQREKALALSNGREEEDWKRHVWYWKTVSGREFEEKLGQLYQQLGYVVEVTPYTRDGGVDLILERLGKRTIVQCKRWKRPATERVVRDLLARMGPFAAHKAVVACTGGFEGGVKSLVKKQPLELLDASDVVRMVHEGNRRREIF